MSLPDLYPAFFALLRKASPHKDGSGRWGACCPAHEDRSPSMTVELGRDGRLMFKCWGGCEKRAILAAMGLGWADVHPPGGDAPYVRREVVIERCHDYYDADGALLYQKCIDRERPGGKGFWRRWDREHGRWIPGLDWTAKGPDGKPVQHRTPRILYRLPELLATPKRLACVTEGEKDADTLADLGFVATTAGGSEDWRPEYAAALARRHVVIFTDHDEAGRRFASSVAGSLVLAGCPSIRLHPWPDSAPEGWDISDELRACRAGGEDDDELAERVREMVRGARHWRALWAA